MIGWVQNGPEQLRIRGTKMSNELKNELRIELSCSKCGLTKTIMVNLDADGVFTIPNKFCPNDLNELSRDVLRQFVSVPKVASEPKSEPNEPTENKTRVSNTVSRPTGILDVPKHGANSSKKA